MPAYRCPTCNKTIRVRRREDAPHRPFCSHRCQMIDLSKWFEGAYRISEPLETGEDTDGPETRDHAD